MDCPSKDKQLQELCLSCGLCCNGVLFRDVKLQTGERPKVLVKLGLPVQLNGKKFKQPCPALSNCECRIYDQRPIHCRTFECLLYKRVQSGEATPVQGYKTVKKARAAVAKVEGLLAQLGDCDGDLPLRVRFRRQMKKGESVSADFLSALSVSMHQLTVILSCDFYD